jgi:integrase
MGYIGHDPIAKMAKPTPRIRQEYVPSDLWPQVLAAATDEPFRDLLTVMLTSGARPQEVFKAEASHFDPAHGRLVFPMEQSKGRKRSRVVWLPDEARAIIARLVKQYPEGKLFRNARGKPWDRNSVRCRFRRLKDILKMPWLTATTLRHSFAHHRLTSGQDSHVVSKLMGHVDGRMIETRYGHVDQNPEFMRQQANRIANPTQPAAQPSQDSAPSQAG